MSVWTHVACVIRADWVKVEDSKHDVWDEVTGRAIYNCDWLTDDDYERARMRRDWADYDRNPEQFMPTGSEGSLQRAVWVNPVCGSAAWYTVTVFGDLRDYDDHKAIRKWFTDTCSKLVVRQAVCTCEAGGETHTWTWGDE